MPFPAGNPQGIGVAAWAWGRPGRPQNRGLRRGGPSERGLMVAVAGIPPSAEAEVILAAGAHFRGG